MQYHVLIYYPKENFILPDPLDIASRSSPDWTTDCRNT